MTLDLSMLVRRVADLARRLDEMPALRWGTVVTSSPLTVRLDGDADAVGGLESLTGTLALGARVLVVRWNRRGVVLGTGSQRGQVIVQTGTVSVDSASTSAKVTGNEFVRFPSAFSSPPLIFFTPDVNPSGLITVGMAVNLVTTTGCNVRYVSTGSAGTRSLKWVAVGVA